MTSRVHTTSDHGRADRICDALRRAILEQALKPGTKLPEDTLGARFGVSRTIARQALGQLAAEGLIDLQRNRGATVSSPSWEDARDLFDVRIGLEMIVMSRLAGKLSGVQVEALRSHVRKEESAAGQSDAIAIRLATEFHLLLAEMTERPVLIRYVRELCLRCGLTLALHRRPHSSDCAISEHLAIIDALRDGDVETTRKIMSDHLEAVADRALVEPPRQASSDLMDILEPYTDRFSGHDGHAARKRVRGG